MTVTLNDLPEDIINMIYKHVFTIDVLPHICSYVPRGDFNFTIKDQEVDMYKILMVKTLHEDYCNIDKLGKKAWIYLKTANVKELYIQETDDALVNSIKNAMSDMHSGCSYCYSMSTMIRIAQLGWQNYVHQCKSM